MLKYYGLSRSYQNSSEEKLSLIFKWNLFCIMTKQSKEMKLASMCVFHFQSKGDPVESYSCMLLHIKYLLNNFLILVARMT